MSKPKQPESATAVISDEHREPIGKAVPQNDPIMIVRAAGLTFESIRDAILYNEKNTPMLDKVRQTVALGTAFVVAADAQWKAVVEKFKTDPGLRNKYPSAVVKRSHWRIMVGAALYCNDDYVVNGEVLDPPFNIDADVGYNEMLTKARAALTWRGKTWEGKNNKAGPKPAPVDVIMVEAEKMRAASTDKAIRMAASLSALTDDQRAALKAAARIKVTNDKIRSRLAKIKTGVADEVKRLTANDAFGSLDGAIEYATLVLAEAQRQKKELADTQPVSVAA